VPPEYLSHTGMNSAPMRDDSDAALPFGGPTPAPGRLPHIGLLRFAGPDAHRFLQGQISNDTSRLSGGAVLLAAYSTAQGRVIAVLHLLPHSSGLIALLPRELLASTRERLRKFVLRAKVDIQDVSGEFSVVGWHRAADRDAEALEAAGIGAPDPARGYAERDGIGIGRVGEDSSRYWVIGPAGLLAERGLAGSGLGGGSGLETARIEHDWRLANIRSGLPEVYAQTSELFVAQMLNLDLIDGISFTKGCFTGQEIIARTQHLGRIKRRMFRLRLPPGTWEIGQALTLDDGRTGRLTELASQGGAFEALAVLSLEPGAPEGEVSPGGGVAAVELPLPYRHAPAA
jgi:tRNA-modifying protein YgfZ